MKSKHCPKIIIYGTGKVAIDLIHKELEEKTLEIVGILDRVRLCGNIEGIPIITWEDVKYGDADRIVIASPERYFKPIYLRIISQAMARGLTVYSYGGQDLSATFGPRCNEYPTQMKVPNLDELKKAIQDYDVISFDIFDTLIMRLVSKPIDIFDLVEQEARNKGINLPKFKQYRRQAELQSNGNNIYYIYKELQNLTGITEQESKELLELELHYEKQMIVPRHDMLQFFQYCQTQGKQVVLTSDMYLTNDMLREILTGVGYTGLDRMYISCEYGMPKAHGLLGRVKEDFVGKRCFHIGDDYEADILPAHAIGFGTCKIGKASDAANMTSLMHCGGFVRTLSDSKLMGSIYDTLFNSPFESAFQVSDKRTFSYIFFRPLVLAYMNLLNARLHEKKYDGVIFVARDGYFFQRCYEKLRSLGLIEGPDSTYVLCSRKLAIRSGMHSKEEVDTILKFYHFAGMKDPVKQVFGVEGIGYDVQNQSIDDYKKIIEHSADTRTGYLQYLEEQGIDTSKKYLFCELDGHGTSYYYMNQLFTQGLDSIYLIRQHTQKEYEVGQTTAFTEWYSGQYRALLNYTTVLESIFTSPASSVIDMTSSGTPVFSEDHRQREQIEYVEELQEELMEQIVSDLKEYPIEKIQLSNQLIDALFDTVSEVELSGECKRFAEATIYDDFMGMQLTTF